MAKLVLQLYLSYAQLCIFLSSLSKPFNDWSDRNYTQGFAWREGSASFRTLVEEGDHKINLFINEEVPELADDVVRAYLVPFETPDGNIEVASISDGTPLEIPAGKYALQVEFVSIEEGQIAQVNIRLNINKGETEFLILRADSEIETNGDLDLEAAAAI